MQSLATDSESFSPLPKRERHAVVCVFLDVRSIVDWRFGLDTPSPAACLILGESAARFYFSRMFPCFLFKLGDRYESRQPLAVTKRTANDVEPITNQVLLYSSRGFLANATTNDLHYWLLPIGQKCINPVGNPLATINFLGQMGDVSRSWILAAADVSNLIRVRVAENVQVIAGAAIANAVR